MNKFVSLVQILAGAVLAVAAAATLVNLLFIVSRPETISVVNAMIGQGLLIICFAALARILIRRGLAGLRSPGPGGDGAQADSASSEESGSNQA